MPRVESILTFGAAGVLVLSGILIQYGGRPDEAPFSKRGSVPGGGGRGSFFSGGDAERLLGRDGNRGITVIRPDFPKPLFAGVPMPPDPPPNLVAGNSPPAREVTIPRKVELISRKAPVTSSDPAPLGELSMITDGDKQADDGYFVDLLPLKQWIQIDLGETREVWLVWLWMYHKSCVTYKDVIIQISDDPAFNAAQTVFNNDHDNTSGMGEGKDEAWMETSFGHPVKVAGVHGRYVRLYSNGRNIDDTNQWIEVEVYGR